MSAVVLLFVMTSILSVWMGYRKVGYLLNPVTVFTLFFFLNNWSLSFTSVVNPDYEFRFSPIDLSPSQYSVLVLNYISYLLSSLILLFGIKPLQKLERGSYGGEAIASYFYFRIFYYTLAIFSFVSGLFSLQQGGVVYGANQAIDVTQTFSVRQAIIGARPIIAIVLLCVGKEKVWKILLIESVLGFFALGRKSLFMVVFAYILSRWEYRRFSLRKISNVFIAVFLLVLVGYFGFFITQYRGMDAALSFWQRVDLINNTIASDFGSVFWETVNSSSSEMVQNWVFQLMQSGDLKQTWGLSYLQGIVNTVVLRPFQGELLYYQAAYYFKEAAYAGVVGHGYDFSFTAEAILNWASFAPLSYLILSFVIVRLYNGRNANQYKYVLYVVVLSSLIVAFRTDSTSLFRIISYFVVLHYIFKNIGRFFKRRNV